MASLTTSGQPVTHGVAAPPSRKVMGVIRGEATEILHIEYSNRDFVIITQVGKIGTVFEVQRKTFFARAVFGQRGSDLMHLYVRMVAALVNPNSEKPLTVCLALKSLSMDDCDELKKLLIQLKSN